MLTILFDGDEVRKSPHILSFQLHRWMNIAVHRDVYACMAKDLAQTFDIKAKFNTSGSKCMSKGMVVSRLN